MGDVGLALLLLAAGAAADDGLTAAGEMGRFPPWCVLKEWYDLNRHVADQCDFYRLAFPGLGWERARAECERLSWPLWYLKMARSCSDLDVRREFLGMARDCMPPEWWQNPWKIEAIPYRWLPAPPEPSTPRWMYPRGK